MLGLDEPRATPQAMPGERAFQRAIVGMVMLTVVALAIVFAGSLVGRF